MLYIRELKKSHGEAPVFSDVTLQVEAGEFVAIVGESGVGKSTLLNCVAGLERPSGGHVQVRETVVDTLDEAAQARFRRRHLGFVFQAFHVLPHLTVAQNVALPLMLLGEPPASQARRVDEALASVGLEGLAARLPQQLSGGQLQRVALARALVHRPDLILADEPTGNLDPETAERIMQLLSAQTHQHGAACVMVTHSDAAARHADRVLRLTAQGVQTVR